MGKTKKYIAKARINGVHGYIGLVMIRKSEIIITSSNHPFVTTGLHSQWSLSEKKPIELVVKCQNVLNKAIFYD